MDRPTGNLRKRGSGSCGTACTLAEGRKPWPGDPRYVVGEDGSIAGPRGTVLVPSIADTGYLTVDTAAGKTHVHVMVAETYLGPRPVGHEVAHEDGNPLNCRIGNLRWSTHLDNMRDRDRHGTVPSGERGGGAKLTELDVHAIRTSSDGPTRLGRRYGVHYKTIVAIRRRKTWRHVA